MNINQLLFLFFCCHLSFSNCIHPIFCQGSILHQIQINRIFPDQKTFVDMPLAYPIQQVLNNFANKKSLRQFIDNNFLDYQSVIDNSILPDWKQRPDNFDLIKNPIWRDFANQLNNKWLFLAKKFNLQKLYNITKCRQNCTSIIQQMNQKMFIVPGGRFRESYYWDTFWIIKGLIASEMYDSAEQIIRNFFLLIDTFGYIPNGFRLYYLGRSQPPLLSMMVNQLSTAYRMHYKQQKAMQLDKDAFQYLIRQHQYWMQTHSRSVNISGRSFKLNFYNANTSSPRPQSYVQDYEIASQMLQQQRQLFYKNIASSAESGWDFSSRWFKDGQNLKTIRTTQIIPTQLNTMIGLMQKIITNIAASFGNTSIFIEYTRLYKQRETYFRLIQNKGYYPDYPDQQFYPSSLYPLLFLNLTTNYRFSELVVPSASMIQTGQQWDYPNVWAPNVWILHQVSNYTEASIVAKKWLTTVYCGWIKYSAIYEKYNANKIGERGEGGQYVVQQGFGWTNGLTLELLMKYGDQLTQPQCEII